MGEEEAALGIVVERVQVGFLSFFLGGGGGPKLKLFLFYNRSVNLEKINLINLKVKSKLNTLNLIIYKRSLLTNTIIILKSRKEILHVFYFIMPIQNNNNSDKIKFIKNKK